MNENIDLTKILKDCPEGTEFYTSIWGKVSFKSIRYGVDYPILLRADDNNTESLTSDGKIFSDLDGECVLFPSREQRDWSKFTASWYKKEKFDPKTLQSFDKVLVRKLKGSWNCDYFSHIHINTPHLINTLSSRYEICIPYNNDTKHLVGTNDEAPEFYKYWED